MDTNPTIVVRPKGVVPDEPAVDGSQTASLLTEDDLAPTLPPQAELPGGAPPQAPAPDGGPNMAQRVASDVGTGIKEAPGQTIRGIEKAANATSGAAFDAANWLNTHIVDFGSVTYDRHGSVNPMKWSLGYSAGMPDANDLQIPDKAIPGPAESVTGGLVEGVSQFTAGMLGAGRFLRVFGAAATTGVAARVVTGAASMAVAFDPHEQRLSDLIEAHPALSNPVTAFLAVHPDDGPGMARVRAGIEGLGLGAATEGLIGSLKALKAHYSGDAGAAVEHADPTLKPGSPSLADDVMNPPNSRPAEGTPGEPGATPPGETAGAAGESPNNPQGDLGLEGGGAGKDSPRPSVEENPTAAAVGTDSPGAGSAPLAKKLVNLSEEDLSRIRELHSNVVNASTPDAEGVFHPLSGIDTDAIEHDGDLGHIMDTLRVFYRDAMDKATGGTPQEGGTAQPVRTFADVNKNVEKLADLIGDNPAMLVQRMGNMHGNLLHLDAETRLYGDFLATVGDKLSKLAKAVDDPFAALPAGFANRAELMVSFAKHYELMANVQAMYRGIQTNTARALNAFKMGSKINPNLLAAMHDPDALFEGGMANMEKLARRINANEGNLPGIAKTTRPGFVKRFLGGLNEYWINSVLSGPKTHMANVIGNSLSAALLPAERMMSGALRIATPAGRQEFLEGGLHYVGMAQSLRDALSLAGKSLKMGSGLLDEMHTPISEIGAPAISASSMGIRTDTISAVVANGLGSVIRLPSRFLTAEDEFFKQLVYRGAIRARAMREGFDQGLWNDPKNPKAFADHISQSLDNATEGDRGIDPAALKQAQYATFQNPLKADTWSGAPTIGETINHMSNSHPMLKVIVPFVRTPTNLLRFVWDRTPGLNMARAQYYKDFTGANGAVAQGQAQARMATGGLLWATAATYALDGTLTGGGPADPDSNKALRATGWLPYSKRSQNDDGTFSYTAYDRTDPFGSFFGLAADFAEVAAAHPEKTGEDTAMSLVTAIARNVENKTFISGLVRALAALGDPDKRGAGFAQGIAGGFVPSFLKQTMLNDDLMRESRSIVDALRARTPGYSASLDPQRNLLGAEVHVTPAVGPDWLSPIAESSRPGGAQPVTQAWREKPNDRPEDELARLMYIHGSALTPPPKTKGTMDLTQIRSDVSGKTAYDRWQELTGTVKINDMTLRENIAHTIQQPFYKNTLTDSDTIDQGSRLGVMQTLIGAYRKTAQEALGKEQPILGAALIEERKRAGMAKFQH